MFGVVTFIVWEFPPPELQEYESKPEPASSVAVPLGQSGVAVIEGFKELDCDTVTGNEVPEQPFISVTVTVYVPAVTVFTDDDAFCPPVH